MNGSSVGDTVVIEPNWACLTCDACRAGVASDCPNRAIVGMNFPGILVERVAVPAEFALPLPAEWPVEVFASFEPLAVDRSAIRRPGVTPGARCLATRAGSQGVLVCLSLLAPVGASPLVTDLHEGRVVQAEELGEQRLVRHRRVGAEAVH